jgi:antitoxin component of MazEF toxin-antitoxin module
MSTSLIRPIIEQVGDERELRVLLPAQAFEELGLDQNQPLVLEVLDGQMIIRRATITEQTAGMGAPWRISPPLTREQEKEAFELAVAEENARYE